MLKLDADACLRPDFLLQLTAAARSHPEAGFFGGKVYIADNREDQIIQTIGNDFGFFLDRFYIGYEVKDLGQFNQELRIGAPNGAAMLVRREVIDQIGGLDESFFMYQDDIDWCLRGKERGIGSVYVPSAVADHKVSDNRAIQTPFRAYHSARSRILLARKHLSPPHFLAWYTYDFGSTQLRTLLAFAARKNRRVLWSTLKGQFDGLTYPLHKRPPRADLIEPVSN